MKIIDLKNPLKIDNIFILQDLYKELQDEINNYQLYGENSKNVFKKIENNFDLKSIAQYLANLEYYHKKESLNLCYFISIGFKFWDGVLFLYPLWAFKLIQLYFPEKFLIYNTFGNKKQIKYIDEDTRIGCVFCGFFRKITTFSDALKALKSGYKVSREGWNGKNMYLFLMPDKWKKLIEEKELNDYPLDICICMKTAKNTNQLGWVASQSDMLANDWELKI